MKFIVSYSSWEDSDYVVTIRPDFEKSWKSVPIGSALSKDEARIVSEWLQTAMPELWKIFSNVSSESQHSGSNQ